MAARPLTGCRPSPKILAWSRCGGGGGLSPLLLPGIITAFIGEGMHPFFDANSPGNLADQDTARDAGGCSPCAESSASARCRSTRRSAAALAGAFEPGLVSAASGSRWCSSTPLSSSTAHCSAPRTRHGSTGKPPERDDSSRHILTCNLAPVGRQSAA